MPSKPQWAPPPSRKIKVNFKGKSVPPVLGLDAVIQKLIINLEFKVNKGVAKCLICPSEGSRISNSFASNRVPQHSQSATHQQSRAERAARKISAAAAAAASSGSASKDDGANPSPVESGAANASTDGM